LTLGFVTINRRKALKKLSIPTTLTLASLIMVAPAAFAQATAATTADEGLSIQARLGIEHDSNVLRQPSGISDVAWTAGVGLRYNKRFSLQRLRADVQWDMWRYQDESQLNFNTLNYNLAWDWSVTPRFHGTISADRRQFREVTTDPTGTVNRIGRRTERTELAEGVFEVGGGWRALAGLSHYRTQSTVPGTWDASPSIRYVHVGAGYESRAGSTATLRYRRGDGEYNDPTFLGAAPALNSDFRDHLVEGVVRWAATGKTTVDARLGHLKRDHDTAPALDFDGIVGGVNVNWDITGKTRLVAGWMRDISASGLAVGGHVESNRFFIAPVWQATGKTSFNLRYDHTRRNWEDVPVGGPGFNRSERLESLQVGVDWEALRTITVSGYARRERMRSSLLNAGYRANVYGVIARANF
jgi:exopolysaccharide biosynthesis operon protein EpsL